MKTVKVLMGVMIWREMYGNGVLITMIKITIIFLSQRILQARKLDSRGSFGEAAFFTSGIMRDVLHGIGFRHMPKVRKSDFAAQRHLKNNLILRVFSQNVPLVRHHLSLKILEISLLQVSGIFL